MVQRVIAAGKRTGTPTGIHCLEPDDALERARQGMQFLAVGSELRMLATRAAEVVERLTPGEGETKLVRY
jgi:4-hydroxy-2-oxoheptanedioate aldolase